MGRGDEIEFSKFRGSEVSSLFGRREAGGGQSRRTGRRGGKFVGRKQRGLDLANVSALAAGHVPEPSSHCGGIQVISSAAVGRVRRDRVQAPRPSQAPGVLPVPGPAENAGPAARAGRKRRDRFAVPKSRRERWVHTKKWCPLVVADIIFLYIVLGAI